MLSAEPKETGVKLTAAEDGTEFVLVRTLTLPFDLLSLILNLFCTIQIAGEPLDQTVMQYGPFVMTNREEIVQTLQDCKF